MRTDEDGRFSRAMARFLEQHCIIGVPYSIADEQLFARFKAFWTQAPERFDHRALLGQFRVELVERGFHAEPGGKWPHWLGLTTRGQDNQGHGEERDQLLSQVLAALSGLFPFLNGLFTNVINLIVVITLSVYFVVDGPRIVGWLRLKTPVARRDIINFLLHALDQSLGGYFRGNLLIGLIGALATGAGLALLHVPYAALLGTLFFFLYFVPVIGGYVIGVLCILAALPLGWVMTLIVAVYVTLLQAIVIGQILSPRIFSKTVGVHPIVALFSLFVGGELFGLLGGLLAVPVAGILQQIIVAIWHRWKNGHPEQFPPEELPVQP